MSSSQSLTVNSAASSFDEISAASSQTQAEFENTFSDQLTKNFEIIDSAHSSNFGLYLEMIIYIFENNLSLRNLIITFESSIRKNFEKKLASYTGTDRKTYEKNLTKSDSDFTCSEGNKVLNFLFDLKEGKVGENMAYQKYLHHSKPEEIPSIRASVETLSVNNNFISSVSSQTIAEEILVLETRKERNGVRKISDVVINTILTKQPISNATNSPEIVDLTAEDFPTGTKFHKNNLRTINKLYISYLKTINSGIAVPAPSNVSVNASPDSFNVTMTADPATIRASERRPRTEDVRYTSGLGQSTQRKSKRKSKSKSRERKKPKRNLNVADNTADNDSDSDNTADNVSDSDNASDNDSDSILDNVSLGGSKADVAEKLNEKDSASRPSFSSTCVTINRKRQENTLSEEPEQQVGEMSCEPSLEKPLQQSSRGKVTKRRGEQQSSCFTQEEEVGNADFADEVELPLSKELESVARSKSDIIDLREFLNSLDRCPLTSQEIIDWVHGILGALCTKYKLVAGSQDDNFSSVLSLAVQKVAQSAEDASSSSSMVDLADDSSLPKKSYAVSCAEDGSSSEVVITAEEASSSAELVDQQSATAGDSTLAVQKVAQSAEDASSSSSIELNTCALAKSVTNVLEGNAYALASRIMNKQFYRILSSTGEYNATETIFIRAIIHFSLPSQKHHPQASRIKQFFSTITNIDVTRDGNSQDWLKITPYTAVSDMLPGLYHDFNVAITLDEKLVVTNTRSNTQIAQKSSSIAAQIGTVLTNFNLLEEVSDGDFKLGEHILFSCPVKADNFSSCQEIPMSFPVPLPNGKRVILQTFAGLYTSSAAAVNVDSYIVIYTRSVKKLFYGQYFSVDSDGSVQKIKVGGKLPLLNGTADFSGGRGFRLKKLFFIETVTQGEFAESYVLNNEVVLTVDSTALRGHELDSFYSNEEKVDSGIIAVFIERVSAILSKHPRRASNIILPFYYFAEISNDDLRLQSELQKLTLTDETILHLVVNLEFIHYIYCAVVFKKKTIFICDSAYTISVDKKTKEEVIKFSLDEETDLLYVHLCHLLDLECTRRGMLIPQWEVCKCKNVMRQAESPLTRCGVYSMVFLLRGFLEGIFCDDPFANYDLTQRTFSERFFKLLKKRILDVIIGSEGVFQLLELFVHFEDLSPERRSAKRQLFSSEGFVHTAKKNDDFVCNKGWLPISIYPAFLRDT